MDMRETVRETMQRYTRDRLRKECRVHGVAAQIARATGFSKPSISAVLSVDKGPGDRLMRALATYWSLTYQQLEEAALEWSLKNPAPAQTRGRIPQPHVYRPLATLPGWLEAVALAKQRHRSIPDEIWEKVAFVYLPDFGEATAERVGRVAQILWDTAPGTPGSEADLTSSYRREFERNPPASGAQRGPVKTSTKRTAQR